MKHFKGLEAFINRCKAQDGFTEISIWSDTVKLGGKLYKMVSYGSTSNMDYAKWYNQKTDCTLCVWYDCPSWQNGKLIKPFKFYEAYLY